MESPGEEFHAAEGPAVAEERAVAPHRRPQCLHCQYDLTGFAVGQVCPECGKKIRALVPHGKSLGAARWASAMGYGATGSVVVGVLLIVAGFVLAPLGVLLLLVSLPLTYIGLITAGAAWWEVRHNPYLYTRRSMRQAKVGLVLCLIPVIVAVLAFTVPMLWALI